MCSDSQMLEIIFEIFEDEIIVFFSCRNKTTHQQKSVWDAELTFPNQSYITFRKWRTVFEQFSAKRNESWWINIASTTFIRRKIRKSDFQLLDWILSKCPKFLKPNSWSKLNGAHPQTQFYSFQAGLSPHINKSLFEMLTEHFPTM